MRRRVCENVVVLLSCLHLLFNRRYKNNQISYNFPSAMFFIQHELKNTKQVSFVKNDLQIIYEIIDM